MPEMSLVSDDPFSPGILPPGGEEMVVSLCQITDSGTPDPFAPKRHVCRAPNGLLYLVDISSVECVTRGEPVTFDVVRDLAAAVLAGDRLALTSPGTTRLVALAFVAALATAELRRRIEHPVSPASTAPAARVPLPSQQREAGADARAGAVS